MDLANLTLGWYDRVATLSEWPLNWVTILTVSTALLLPLISAVVERLF